MSSKKFKILIATANKNKIREIKKILGERFRIVALKNPPKINENGRTLLENAVKKAKGFFRTSRIMTLADDTGLEVEILGGLPGVHSARFAGKKCSYADNNAKLLKLLDGIPFKKRKAKFVTVVALILPGGRVKTVSGEINGYILNGPRGYNGFGYDPVFYYPRLKKTFAELTIEEKNKISHRGKALRKAKNIVENYVNKSKTEC